MSIYEDLAPIYDDLFPQNPAATAFLLGLPRRKNAAQGLPKRVLDIGCATASQLLELAAAGWEAFGLEPSLSMRERAQAKARRSGLTLQISEGSMLDARSRFSKGHFGLLLCIGNTLPYLRNEEELREFLRGAASLLAPGGSLVLQTLNYQRVLASFGKGHGGSAESYAFPELRAGGATFRRRYEEAQGGRLAFITEVFQEGKETAREASLLTPFRPEALVKVLEKSEFDEPLGMLGCGIRDGEANRYRQKKGQRYQVDRPGIGSVKRTTEYARSNSKKRRQDIRGGIDGSASLALSLYDNSRVNCRFQNAQPDR